MSDIDGVKNGRHGWKDWIVGVTAALIILGVAGLVAINAETARTLGQLEQSVSNLESRAAAFEKAFTAFYTEAEATRDLAVRDRQLENLESRLERLEQRPSRP